MGDSSQTIIPLEDGWNNEIKTIALDPLEQMLGNFMILTTKTTIIMTDVCKKLE